MILKRPHRHAQFIHAYADGAKIQMRNSFNEEWIDLERPDWSADYYRIAPEQESLYPRSTLNYSELCQIVNQASRIEGNEGIQTKIARLAADTAVAAFIESGEMRKYVEQYGLL